MIVSLGEVLWDLFPEGARFGGAPANFACHAASLGANVSMVSAVGADQRGRAARDVLQGFGVDVALVQTASDAPTGTVGVALDPAGKPTFTIDESSAWDRMAWNESLASRVVVADAVYFGTLGQRSELSRTTIRRCAEAARAAEVIRIVDINLRAPFFDNQLIRDSIELASVLKLSDDELPRVCEACGVKGDSPAALVERLRDAYQLDYVVMTRGAKGALLSSASQAIDQPGIPTEVVDTVGAGDAFTAALVVGLLRGLSDSATLEAACETASAVCRLAGAVPTTSRVCGQQSHSNH